MPITGLYAAALALILLVLWTQVSGARMKTGIAILHGDDLALAYRIRRHANFVEHVPMALVLLAIIERGGAPAPALHLLGGALTIARVLHPIGLRPGPTPNPPRALGAGMTFLVILAAAAIALWQLANRWIS